MRSFFKYVFATLVGVIIFNIIIVLIFIASLGAAISKAKSSNKDVYVKANSILKIKLDGKIVDRANENPLDNFNFAGFSFNVEKTLGLNHILRDIEKAKNDSNIKGILINIGNVSTGLATMQEIRNKLLDFKKSGKFILSYEEVYDQKNYYLSSVADKVYLNPAGLMEIKGFGVTELFFKKGLDKIGVQAQVIRHGKFKSAVEPFMIDSMSPANKKQVHRYIGTLWTEWKEAVSKSRNIPISIIDSVANNLLINQAEDAIKYKFVDSLIYRDQLMDILKNKVQVDKPEDIEFISLSRYDKTVETNTLENFISKDQIAIIYASGDIVSGTGKSDDIGSERICKAIRKARKDSDVKAIVFRVNSPGGSALASDVIWREVYLANKEKPVIVSMGNYAASGGYYISCAATKIIADPMTISGSIGVFGVIPNAKKLFNKYLGITTDTALTNNHSDLFNLYRPLTSYERAVIKGNIEATYKTFVSRVSKGRNKSEQYIDSIGQGRVWSGVDAKKRGLVDEFGGLEKAIEIAAKTANLDKYGIEELPKRESTMDKILKVFGEQTKISLFGKDLNMKIKDYSHWLKQNRQRGVIARMPYQVISF